MSAAGWTVSCRLPAGWRGVDLTDPGHWPAGPNSTGPEPTAWRPAARELAPLRELLSLARTTGVVLSATRGRGGGTPEDPLSLLTLSLAVRPWAPAGHRTGTAIRPTHAAAFEFEEPMLSGYLTVARCRQPLPGGAGDLASLLIQILGFAPAAGLLVAVSATTADPAAEDELAIAAVGVALSLRLARAPARPAAC
ncbi:MAG: hypothetical protein L0Y54_16410 [Sporichthyaceae bacterium]|nr:hypothetical protein [Sporichthyaceae bacterium]